jgi:hypothetical protein
MKHHLRGSNSRAIGTITKTPAGKLEGRDANGRFKDSYNPKTDQTRSSNGGVVRRGNVLTVVIISCLFV